MHHSSLGLALAALTAGTLSQAAETLYNGIVLPAEWPPRHELVTARAPEPPSYLQTPPAVIPIDVGRQLFVDSFLIERTDLRRTFHQAQYYSGNPVVKPDKSWEVHGNKRSAMAFSDGVWYDPKDNCFKMWYLSGWDTLYATSIDGVHWEKPLLDVQPGTNVVHSAQKRDSSTVWLDLEEKNPQRRYKFAYSKGNDEPLALHYSADGIHWGNEITESPPLGDRSTLFWNPFRRVWVVSLRDSTLPDNTVPGNKPPGERNRVRAYHESRDIESALHWGKDEPAPWVGADRLDPTRVDLGIRPELYNLDAIAYESVMVGFFSIWRGQPDRNVQDKPNEICVGFSRDGFYWDRSFRQPLIPVAEQVDAWNHSNVQSVGGGCLVVGDRLYFYVSGRAGAPAGTSEEATGLATLRRDGFVSMDAGSSAGTLTTRPIQFHGGYLFVNVDSEQGELAVEVLDQNYQVIAPFSLEQCIPVRVDNTLQPVHWKDAGNLAALKGKPVRFRFHLHDGKLYSFWVSPDSSGASHGYVAAGGPGFNGPVDTVGATAYEHGWIRKSLYDVPFPGSAPVTVKR